MSKFSPAIEVAAMRAGILGKRNPLQADDRSHELDYSARKAVDQ